MALQDVFLAPAGLAAALVAVPILVLYLVRPDPSRVELPTFRFLTEGRRQQAVTPLLERLSRSLLLVVQLLVVLLLAVSLASPYVPVSERTVVEETVLVVDTSASMATADGEPTRFDRALAAAREEVTDRTSLVTTADGGRVLLQRGPPGEARERLDALAVTDAPGELRGALAQAAAVAGEDARIVVVSDFAGDGWTDAAATARARGLSVVLRQFDGGGADNVGFIDRRFSGEEVALSVKNFGEEPVTRRVTFGGRERQVALDPDDVGVVRFPVPAGGGEARLSPGDEFPTDDRVFVAAPADATVDVLVLTNDRNRFLITALDVADQVEVSVATPPTTVREEYDVVVYSNVDPDSLLPGNVETGRDTLARGGGVAIQAQPTLPDRYGDLLLLEPEGLGSSPTVFRTAETPLTRGIDFQPPDEYVLGSLREGETLVELRDGSPLLATAERNGGRILYYGYIEERSGFKFNYQYPVFWKRAMFRLAGREPLGELNHETGETVHFGADGVEGPSGALAGPSADIREAGFYTTPGGRESASLLDEAESAVGAEPLTDRSEPVAAAASEERRTVPRPLTQFVALAALAVALLELAYLRRRGDL